MVVHDRRSDAHVLCFALENHFRRTDPGAAPPFLDDARITGARERTGAEIAADIKRVTIAPCDAALGFRQYETIGDELFLIKIELAHDRRVRAAARKKDQRPVMAWPKNICVLPNPVFFLGFSEFVEVENDFPCWLHLSVFRQCRAPPQSA